MQVIRVRKYDGYAEDVDGLTREQRTQGRHGFDIIIILGVSVEAILEAPNTARQLYSPDCNGHTTTIHKKTYTYVVPVSASHFESSGPAWRLTRGVAVAHNIGKSVTTSPVTGTHASIPLHRIWTREVVP